MFIKSFCTDKVFSELGLPDWLRQSADSPIDREIVYDLDLKVALIDHAYDHSTYPERGFSLYIVGKYLSVWEGEFNLLKPYIIRVYVPENAENLEDLYLKSILLEALIVFDKVRVKIVSPTIIIKREVPATPQKIKPPRSPQEIISTINRAVDGIGSPEPALELLATVFVPMLVKQEELAEFLRYGIETSWRDLSSNAQIVVDLVLQKRKLAGELS